jgi:hypothetical protein
MAEDNAIRKICGSYKSSFMYFLIMISMKPAKKIFSTK